jgi:hypothetical protein
MSGSGHEGRGDIYTSRSIGRAEKLLTNGVKVGFDFSFKPTLDAISSTFRDLRNCLKATLLSYWAGFATASMDIGTPHLSVKMVTGSPLT